MTYPFICQVSYFDECRNRNEAKVIIPIYADSFSDAAQIIEDQFGDDLISLTLEAYEEGCLFCIPDTKENYELLKDNV